MSLRAIFARSKQPAILQLPRPRKQGDATMRVLSRFAGLLLMMLALSPAKAETLDTVDAEVSRDVAIASNELTEILKQQVAAWNAADIAEFMNSYWKSEKLTFSSGGTTRRGWQATLESYEKKYPTPEKMGQLRFSGLEIDLLGGDVALVLGKWQLKRKEDPDIGGNFSLVFRKLENRWVIIHDHSSALKKD